MALVALAGYPRLRSRAALVTFVAATVLVANILPRQVINRIFPIDAMLRWTGHTHLTLSEGYQYFGFPLAGLFATAICLAALRRTMNRSVLEGRAAVAGL